MRRNHFRATMLVCCVVVITYVVLQAVITFNNDSGLYRLNSSDSNTSTQTDTGLYYHSPEIQNNLRNQKPVYHVGFLKVHKAGSTTIQNILFRFALRYNLTLLLPKRGLHLRKRGEAMLLKRGNHYDIFACHTNFRENIFGLLPNDSLKFAIIREPLQRTISAAYYYRDVFRDRYLMRIPKDKFIDKLVSSPEKFNPKPFSCTRNSMGKDFGFSGDLKNEKVEIESHMNHLKKEFKLVLVMERFEESLLLLKREFNWTLQDIVFIQLNAHNHDKDNLTETQKLKFRETNFLDYAIYETFYRIFDTMVRSLGRLFDEEVVHFKMVLTNIRYFCESTSYQHRALKVRQSKWNLEFEIRGKDCDLMQKKEISFIEDLRARHKSMQK